MWSFPLDSNQNRSIIGRVLYQVELRNELLERHNGSAPIPEPWKGSVLLLTPMPLNAQFLEAAGGFEPPNIGFADRRLDPLGYAAKNMVSREGLEPPVPEAADLQSAVLPIRRTDS